MGDIPVVCGNYNAGGVFISTFVPIRVCYKIRANPKGNPDNTVLPIRELGELYYPDCLLDWHEFYNTL
jgi:hypothetical protein